MEMTTIGAAIYKDIEKNEYLNKLYDKHFLELIMYNQEK